MRARVLGVLLGTVLLTSVTVGGQGAAGQAGAVQGPAAGTPANGVDPVIKGLVARLDLEKYKATIKGLTQFGDRRQGTKRNRDAVDWIEAQLKSYGCATERVIYTYPSPGASSPTAGARGAAGGRGGQGAAATGANPVSAGQAPSAAAPPPAAGAAAGAGAGRQGAGGTGGRGRGQVLGPLAEPVRTGEGGSSLYGNRGRTGVNTDPMLQPDEALRALNSEPTTPGERQEVFCTKVGATHPEEMYIVGAHMDGHGWGEGANDDGSGTALVMELARVFNSPDVQTDRSIRFALWNNEETGLNGAWAYVNQRKDLQGIENPRGSGKYPEPKWLGMIQHDMMLWDHGMPGPDGQVSKEQRPEADFNIEFQMASKQSEGAQKLAWAFKAAADKYSMDYPATVGPHMTNTDSGPFMDLIPAISLRENERGMHTGSGWNPTWHQPIDVFSTFSDKDFKLGLNAAQTTLAAIAQLTGAKLK